MALSRATLRINNRTRRTVISSLFGLTFFASVVTVSASDALPCPAHPLRKRYADGESSGEEHNVIATVDKRPKRWIEEKHPNSRDV
ncbi:hypothetical protein BV25DRAFT_1806088 [Artomyces pyxidatus]|uniref:Uncharacterized protein n=1 Tax=Artomyces pyxidatus TaxID=48021 RepID=A0ACB8SXA2_9AGAM|nr:hypothetical protein BV25DRAFT_1806088 [Artomyces pyxidatus]